MSNGQREKRFTSLISGKSTKARSLRQNLHNNGQTIKKFYRVMLRMLESLKISLSFGFRFASKTLWAKKHEN